MNDVTLSMRGGPENLVAHCGELESPADGTPRVRVLKSRREMVPGPERQEIHASSTSVHPVPQLTGCCPLCVLLSSQVPTERFDRHTEDKYFTSYMDLL